MKKLSVIFAMLYMPAGCSFFTQKVVFPDTPFTNGTYNKR